MYDISAEVFHCDLTDGGVIRKEIMQHAEVSQTMKIENHILCAFVANPKTSPAFRKCNLFGFLVILGHPLFILRLHRARQASAIEGRISMLPT